MHLQLAENIRSFRKQRKLTQEQLAELFGVTTGAVHKWETGLSVPELRVIVEMADFFDISVDVLLGYAMKDNRPASTMERLNLYCRSRNADALIEAEKALKKYPNSFEIVHGCAGIYLTFGSESHNEQQLRRAIELLEQSILLIAQNNDPTISEYGIYGQLGRAYIMLGEHEKGLSLLKRHNTSGIFNDFIGTSLALDLARPEEAEPYLSAALLRGVIHLVNAAIGLSILFSSRGEDHRAQEVVCWGQEIIRGLKRDSAPDFLDKLLALLFALQAHTQMKIGQKEAAQEALCCAADYAHRFDAAPDYGADALRFAELPKSANLNDTLGSTAMESVAGLIEKLKNERLLAAWKEVLDHGSL